MSGEAEFDPHQLDTFSQAVAQELFEQRPDWLRFARAQKDGDTEPYLLIEIHPERAPKDIESWATAGILLHTSDSEITYGFDSWHGHCSGESLVDKAIADIEAIIDDRSVVIACLDEDGSLVWSGLISTNELAQTLHDERKIYRVRSWSGTLDRLSTEPT